jgi:DNA-binding NarL/FixJ family response regulator
MSNGFMNESCLKSDDSFAIPQEILQDCLALAKLNKSGAQIVPLSFHRTININQNKKLHVKTCVISQSFNSASAFNFLVTMDYLSKIHECNEIVLRERYRLTRREAEIIELVSQGLSNNEISSELYISRSTVETHIKNIYQKMGIKNRVTLSNLIQFG